MRHAVEEPAAFGAESETRETKIRMQNIYCEWILGERIKEVGPKQSQSEVVVCYAFEKPKGFE